MAKKRKVEEASSVVEKPKEAVKEVKSSGPTLKKAIITDRETLLKLQDEARLVGYDPKTGEATYKEA